MLRSLAIYSVLSVCLVAVARAAEPGKAPISPKEGVIQLFNGSDLSGWYTFLKDTKYEDPRKVFTSTTG